MEDPGRAAGQGRRVAPGRDPVAGRLGDRQPDGGLADEPREQADRVRSAADAGQDEVGQPPFDGEQLHRCLVADRSLEVAHQRRVRMRAHRGADDVVGRGDVGDPVAHRLVDGVLEGRAARRHRANLGAQRLHPQHVGPLPLDVLGAHVDDARQAEQRAGGRGRHAVLAGPGLGDDPGLAEAAGQERLAEGVVDLVGTGVGEVLALQVDAERIGGAGLAPPASRLRGGERRRAPAVRRDRAASAGRRRSRAARAAPPRTGGPPGSRSRPARGPGGPPSASRARTARRTRGRSPTGRAGSASSRPGWTGVGPAAIVGRSARAARARFVNRATRNASLRGRRPGTRGASTPEATSTPIAGTTRNASPTSAASRPPARTTGTSRAMAAASSRATWLPVPPGYGPPAVSSRIRSQPPGPRYRRASAIVVATRSAASAGATTGRWSTFQAGRSRRAVTSGDSEPDSWMTSGSTAATIRASCSAGQSAVTATMRGRRSAGRDPAGVARQLGGLVEREGARRARHQVEPDRIGSGAHGGRDPIGIGDPADLHRGDAAGIGRVGGRAARRDESPRGGGRLGRAHQGLADESAVEPEGLPAANDRRLADARLGDDEPVLRNESTQPRGTLRIDGQRPQVAVVEADQAGMRGQRPVELTLVVGFDEGFEPRSRARSTSPASRPAG